MNLFSTMRLKLEIYETRCPSFFKVSHLSHLGATVYSSGALRLTTDFYVIEAAEWRFLCFSNEKGRPILATPPFSVCAFAVMLAQKGCGSPRGNQAPR